MLFAQKTAKLTGKVQGILDLTVLSPDEIGIALIQFPLKLFPQALQRSEAVQLFVLKTPTSDC